MEKDSERRSIVIIGGGIIGCTTAYYLTRHPNFTQENTKVTLVEASKMGVAQGASGKAGGLVAKWAYPKELVDITYSEHVRLAEEHNGADRWGWRFVNCGAWEGRARPKDEPGLHGASASLNKLSAGASESKRRRNGLPGDLDWVEESLTDSYSAMAGSQDTAQVHPYLFTKSMMDLALDHGATYLSGRALGTEERDDRVTGVRVKLNSNGEETTLPATHVILAAGAWSPSLIPSLPISPMRAHSVTIKTSAVVSPYVLFTEIAMPTTGRARTRTVSPEIYARPDGDVYACGKGDSLPLPDTVDDVQTDEHECDVIIDQVTSISEPLRQGRVQARQACYLPNGGPFIGQMQGTAKGIIVGAGHTCWGICNAPGTAKAISELVIDGKITCGNLTKLCPR